ncbi:MAG: YwaF family protein [Acholeplasmataceae bacterium]|nr:YwaF family protein [Acholeplasmataceae bacterium]
MDNFGYKHLMGLFWLFAVIFLALVLLLRFRKAKRKGTQFDLWVIRGAALFMWAWEGVKTVYMIRSESFGGVGNYPAFMLPLHICSMALYAYVIIGFKPGKLANFMKPFGFATMMLVTSLILVIPASSGILGDVPNWSFVSENIMPFQSFFYHGSVVFVPLYMVLSGFYKPKASDTWKALVVTFATAAVAFTANKLLLVTDFMMLEVGNGSPFKSMVEDQYALYVLLLGAIVALGTFILLGLFELGAMILKTKAPDVGAVVQR